MKLLKELVAQSHCQKQKNMLKLNLTLDPIYTYWVHDLTEDRDSGRVKLIVIP